MPERNFANRTLFHGDNRPVLRGMNSGTVNLIATDPPCNTNRDFHATPDSLTKGAQFQDRWRWDEDVHEDWLIAMGHYNHPRWFGVTIWPHSFVGWVCGYWRCTVSWPPKGRHGPLGWRIRASPQADDIIYCRI